MEQIGSVSFKFSSRFSSLIGRNLISNPIVAVSELVKNAYDADADNITLTFNNLKSGISELIIEDDGEGMSFDDISLKWMVVGTDNKVSSPISSKGRRKLGEKGIGRFSVERLSKKLEITTSKAGNNFALNFEINWDEDENKGEEFGKLDHAVYRIPYENYKSGTKIVMRDLRDAWDEDDLLNLRKELNIIRPIDINEVSYKKYDFQGSKVNIRLNALDYLGKNNKIDSHLMKYHQAHLFGEIRSDGTAFIKVYIKSNISMSGADMYEEKEYKDGELDVCCGPLSFEGFVFLKDKRLYKSLEVDKANFSEYLDTFCGVKIYRDGFRILPFGDVDNDWLELNAQRAASPEHRIGTKNTIGVVYITRDDNAGLQDVLSRENMYDTQEFTALKRFVNKVYDFYTSLQLNARKKKEIKKVQEGKKALGDAKKSVNDFTKSVSALKESFAQNENATDIDDKEIVSRVQNNLSTIIETAETSLKSLETAYSFYKLQGDFKARELQIYRNIATLGISAAMFGHEALNQTTYAKSICRNVKKDFQEVLSQVVELNEQIDLLQKQIALINEKADFFRSYLKKEKQDRARYVNLYDAIENILIQHKNAFADIGVIPEVNSQGMGKNDFMTWGYEGDFDTVFANIVTNAYKALKKGKGEKYFKIKMIEKDGNIEIVTQNNGKPIEPQDRKKIFQPLFSTYADGTGLGLTIAQDTISGYDGDIHLMDNYPDTCFKITIPKKNDMEEE